MGDKDEKGSQLRPHIVWFGEAVPLIEDAAMLTEEADIFMVVGTSLVVYPAAGLVSYAQPRIPKFILDKKIPATYNISNLTAIEASATQGVELLRERLKELM